MRRTTSTRSRRFGLAAVVVALGALVALAGCGTAEGGGGGGAPGPTATLTSTPTPPATSSPLATPGTPSGGDVLTRPIQIDQVQVILAESHPVQVSVHVTGYLSDSCTVAREPEVRRSGDTVTVTILGDRPRLALCAQVILPYERTIPLGSFSPGSYTVRVNDVTRTFRVD